MGPSLKVFMGFMFCATEKCWARPRLDKVLVWSELRIHFVLAMTQ